MSPKSVVRVRTVPSVNDLLIEVENRIRLRAYDRFMQRGSEPGHELEDWYGAAADLIDQPRIALSETEADLVLVFYLPDAALKNLELLATGNSLLLQGLPYPSVGLPGLVHLCEFYSKQVFRFVELPRSSDAGSISVEVSGPYLRVIAPIGAVATEPPKPKPRARTKAKAAGAGVQ